MARSSSLGRVVTLTYYHPNENEISKIKGLPLMFIINGQENDVCLPTMCASFYEELCKNKVPAEMHIYAKGGHGFSLGFDTGHSTTHGKTASFNG